jgi:hypothetical protein
MLSIGICTKEGCIEFLWPPSIESLNGMISPKRGKNISQEILHILLGLAWHLTVIKQTLWGLDLLKTMGGFTVLMLWTFTRIESSSTLVGLNKIIRLILTP